MQYTIVYEGDDDEGWSAFLPDVPGCIAAAATRKETEELIHRAVELHIEATLADGDPMPEPGVYAEQIEIEIDGRTVRMVQPVQA